ncbi:MAG: diadenylate cyclase CdaA [Oscillospiraceae bacterium]|nr:diadenylate cyclase CdaA [Oscillospiraceae bacterium]
MTNIGNILNTFRNIVSTISVWDAIDMAIIAVLVYSLLTFVRKTNSANVVKGIMLLVIILWITNLLKLSVISYLLGKTFELGILALVVLFQPEIRRLFEKMGSSDFRSILNLRTGVYETEKIIEQVAAACDHMSSYRIGALIVIERSNNLESYINTGTIIDALPATELIKNLFYPKSPMHDGAVIIRSGRIAGAACMLPLTSNALDNELGMRHRAGIGMSERADAVVIIVSEETGSVSVAVNGMLKRNLKPETFRRLLKNELIPEETKTKRKKFSLFKTAGDRK